MQVVTKLKLWQQSNFDKSKCDKIKLEEKKKKRKT